MKARQLIAELTTGKTLLVATNAIQEAQVLAQRMIIVLNGRLVYDGSLEDAITRDPARIDRWVSGQSVT